jgi:hypothetical protein
MKPGVHRFSSPPCSGANIDTCGNWSQNRKNDLAGGNWFEALKIVLPMYICPSDTLPKQDDEGMGKSNYLGNCGWEFGSYDCAAYSGANQNGVLLFDNQNDSTYMIGFADIKDGSSNTIAVGEVSETANVLSSKTNDMAFPVWSGGNGGGCQGWGIASCLRIVDTNMYINRRDNTRQSDMSFGSQHTRGGNFLSADGSVHFLSDSINTNTYRALGGRNDGVPVSWDN